MSDRSPPHTRSSTKDMQQSTTTAKPPQRDNMAEETTNDLRASRPLAQTGETDTAAADPKTPSGINTLLPSPAHAQPPSEDSKQHNTAETLKKREDMAEETGDHSASRQLAQTGETDTSSADTETPTGFGSLPQELVDKIAKYLMPLAKLSGYLDVKSSPPVRTIATDDLADWKTCCRMKSLKPAADDWLKTDISLTIDSLAPTNVGAEGTLSIVIPKRIMSSARTVTFIDTKLIGFKLFTPRVFAPFHPQVPTGVPTHFLKHLIRAEIEIRRPADSKTEFTLEKVSKQSHKACHIPAAPTLPSFMKDVIEGEFKHSVEYIWTAYDKGTGLTWGTIHNIVARWGDFVVGRGKRTYASPGYAHRLCAAIPDTLQLVEGRGDWQQDQYSPSSGAEVRFVPSVRLYI